MSWFDYVTNRYNIFENDTKNDIISVAVMFYSCVNDYGKINNEKYQIKSINKKIKYK